MIIGEGEGFFSTPIEYTTFSLKNDSFFIATVYSSDYNNSCGSFERKAFAKGVFSIEKNVLIIEGIHTDSTFYSGPKNCASTGKYNKTFVARFCGATLQLYDQTSGENSKYNTINLERK